MGQVTVSVNGRDYAIACADGEESHIADLAVYVDHHARTLAQKLGPVTEARLLLMAALTIDELRAERRGALDELARLAGRLEGVAAAVERP
jgi:cell division protein ZapA